MQGNKNFFFMIVFVIGFFVFWDKFVVSRYRTEPPKPSAQQVNVDQKAAEPQPSSTIAKTPPQAAVQTPLPRSNNQRAEENIVLKGETSEVVLGSLGARVLSWKVKERDGWIEIIAPNVETDSEFPVSMLQTFPELSFAVQKASEKKVTLVAQHPDGYQIQKTLALDTAPSMNSLQISFINTGSNRVLVQTNLPLGPGLGKQNVAEPFDKKEYATIQAEMRAAAWANKIFDWQPGMIFGRTVEAKSAGPFQWVGVDNAHFLVALVNANRPIENIHIQANKKVPSVLSIPIQLELGPGESEQWESQLYAGPKVIEGLRDIGSNLEMSIDFGFFGLISKGLLKGLLFFKGITGNYGWAIIILTVCVQILFFPLTKKSLQHSVKMKELQPQLKKIQKEFKQDPKRLQIETLNLYKKHGMKFMGMEGCFPMLLQIPIFFAFYQTLRIAYELRGAPWIFWIQDLAVYDPYFVLPVVMGLGMFAQQKLTAVAMDPAQAKMMLIMPIMFTFFFLKLPAGLVLYWVVNSIMTVVVQKILQFRKEHLPKPA